MPSHQHLDDYSSKELVSEPKGFNYCMPLDFFSYYSFLEAKEQLWTWLEVTVTGNFPKDLSRQKRSNILDFYRRLENLIESTYQIHAEAEKKQTS